jgi:hypothetical protein
MATLTEPLTDLRQTEWPAWKRLDAHCQAARTLHLRDLFADDQSISNKRLVRRISFR